MSPPEDPLAFFRNLPTSSTSATEIAGNVSAADKQLNANILAYFLGGFASDIGSRIKLVRIDVWKKEGGRMEARAVCEIEVTKDMANVYGIMHGACGAYLVDGCSTLPLVVIGLATNSNRTGVSQTLNLVYHSGARVGTKLSIVSTSITALGRVMASRCEIYDKATERILVSAVHTKVDPGAKIPLNPTSKL